MKYYLTLFGALLLLVAILAGCNGSAPVPATTESPDAAVSGEAVLEVIGTSETRTLSMADLMALPVTEGYGGIKSSTGKITAPTKFKGVALSDLVAAVGGIDETNGLNVYAKDGYSITFSYDQAINGNYIQYDPATGDELKNPVELTTIVAYEQDGKPIDPTSDGPLRLAVVSAEPVQVVDGHWAVKWTTRVAAKSLVEEWTLAANGGIEDVIDRGTFESCSAPQCHGATWTDEKAQEWVGVPLYIIVGGVDDEVKHEGLAFNTALAEAGYTVDVSANDGYTVTFDSARIARNKNIIIAHSVNGNPLDEKYFPLRLVGLGLEKSEMVGAIAEVKVGVEPVPTAQPVAVQSAPAQPGSLVITGLVNQSLTLNESILRALPTIKVTAEHPKKGLMDFEGIALSTLLDMAGVQGGAATLVVTAADGYKAEISLTDARACTDNLIAFTDTPGSFYLVMPELTGDNWVKDVATIELK